MNHQTLSELESILAKFSFAKEKSEGAATNSAQAAQSQEELAHATG